MNITLFGGSFNPPHLGHQIVITQTFELIPEIDQIWLLPDYQHAFSKNQHLASPKHRLAMTKILASTLPKVTTQTCTFDHKMPGHSLSHLKYMQKTYPQHNFSFLIGSDNLITFHKWFKYKTLLKSTPFYIYPRADHPFKPLYANMTPLKHPLQIFINLSSTIIRNRLKKGLSVNHLISRKIAKYLSTHQLYL